MEEDNWYFITRIDPVAYTDAVGYHMHQYLSICTSWVMLLFPGIHHHMFPTPTCQQAANWTGDWQVTLLSSISQCNTSLIDKTRYVLYPLGCRPVFWTGRLAAVVSYHHHWNSADWLQNYKNTVFHTFSKYCFARFQSSNSFFLMHCKVGNYAFRIKASSAGGSMKKTENYSETV